MLDSLRYELGEWYEAGILWVIAVMGTVVAALIGLVWLLFRLF